MNRIAGIVLAIASASLPQTAASADIEGKLAHGGKERTFLLTVPERQPPALRCRW